MENRKLVIIWSFLLLTSLIQARQGNDIVVLVDVSGSVRNIVPARQEARDILKDLVTRGQFNAGQYSNWEFSTAVGNLASIRQGGGNPLLGLNHRVFLRKAGEKNTSLAPVASQNVCNSLLDFDQFLDDQFPTSFTDNWTYLKLAKASAARFALQNNTCSYLLIEVTDSREDRIPSSPYSTEEQNLVDSYGVKSNIETATVGIIRYKPESNYQIIISEVNIVGNNCQQTAPCAANNTQPSRPVPVANPRIVLNRLSDNDKEPEVLEPNDGRLTLSWQCIDCPDAVNYRVILKKSGTNQSEILVSESNLAREQLVVSDLSAGEYEFSVSASGTLVSIKSDKGYFKIKGGGGFWIVLVLLALGLGGFAVYKKVSSGQGKGGATGRRKKPGRKKEEPEDPFAESGSSSSGDDSFDF